MSELVELICVNCRRHISTLVNKPVEMVCSSCGGKFWIKSLSFRNISCLHCGFNKGLEAHELIGPHLCIKNKYSSSYCIGLSSKESIETIDSGNEKLLFIRGRGLGDLLMCTPAIRELKRKNNGLELWVACDEYFFELFYNNPNVDGWVNIKRYKSLSNVKKKVIVEEQLESYKNKENRKNRIDRIFEISGVEGDHSLDYFVSKKEKKWAKDIFSSKKKRVGFGLQSGALYRNWPLDNYKGLSKLLIKDDWEVILFGEEQVPWFGSGVVNTTRELSIRQLGAVLQLCNVVVCGDSGISHFCGALGVKNIILYGSIPPDMRCKYYPKAVPLFANIGCSPCWDLQILDRKDTLSCRDTKGSDCMNAISVEEVAKKVLG